MIHSPDDEMIPFSHGKKIFEAANEPKRFMQISGSHNEGFINSGEQYIRGLKGFLSSGGPPRMWRLTKGGDYYYN